MLLVENNNVKQLRAGSYSKKLFQLDNIKKQQKACINASAQAGKQCMLFTCKKHEKKVLESDIGRQYFDRFQCTETNRFQCTETNRFQGTETNQFQGTETNQFQCTDVDLPKRYRWGKIFKQW
jgi:hypothetical protein